MVVPDALFARMRPQAQQMRHLVGGLPGIWASRNVGLPIL
ncbi:hypothetical protein THTE_1135 [Thermogutta terrifontis]|uniref:Uncharacterized protein n=1 Tax=Thermogutta terrifontis TaxID=1331910 RepID=A0A286RCU3_9BACT|nr:hypothetical protein THTE_1135 [Thermogutta terrifontis]